MEKLKTTTKTFVYCLTYLLEMLLPVRVGSIRRRECRFRSEQIISFSFLISLWLLWLCSVTWSYTKYTSTLWSVRMRFRINEQWDTTKTSSDSATWVYWWLLNSCNHFNSDAHFFFLSCSPRTTRKLTHRKILFLHSVDSDCEEFCDRHFIYKLCFWMRQLWFVIFMQTRVFFSIQIEKYRKIQI